MSHAGVGMGVGLLLRAAPATAAPMFGKEGSKSASGVVRSFLHRRQGIPPTPSPPPQLSVLVCSASCCTAQPLQNTHMQSRTSGSRAGSPPTGSNCFPQVWQDGCICLALRICLIRDGWGAKNEKMTKDLYRKNINYSFNSMDMYVRVLPFNRWRYLIGCHFRETQRDNVSHVKV